MGLLAFLLLLNLAFVAFNIWRLTEEGSKFLPIFGLLVNGAASIYLLVVISTRAT